MSLTNHYLPSRRSTHTLPVHVITMTSCLLSIRWHTRVSSFVRSFVRSIDRSIDRSIVRSFVRSFETSYTDSCSCWLVVSYCMKRTTLEQMLFAIQTLHSIGAPRWFSLKPRTFILQRPLVLLLPLLSNNKQKPRRQSNKKSLPEQMIAVVFAA